MENKKIGVLVLSISVILVVLFIVILRALNLEAEAMGCFPSNGCQKIETSLSVVHFAFGLFGFLFALGIYLLWFTAGEQAIVQRLEKDSSRKLEEEKFAILLQGVDQFEKRVLTLLKTEEGIAQSMVGLRTEMSKAKVSQVVSGLEKKGLIARRPEGKGLRLYLKQKWT